MTAPPPARHRVPGHDDMQWEEQAMQTEIIANATGTTTTTSANVIELSAPSVVRLNIDRAQVATMEREGNDLIIRLTDGQTIRID
ncbi:MAG: BapA prefix-like domain-containing protein, partial [Sphingomonas parapaucimobilis]